MNVRHVCLLIYLSTALARQLTTPAPITPMTDEFNFVDNLHQRVKTQAQKNPHKAGFSASAES
ncbi:MAG: hypothetical protein HPY82_01925 [Gammaproteobacteria bacterium]|nr:hypothetical protein [Gammaproteobacteria bacterium]